jgi:hypothetical protein
MWRGATWRAVARTHLVGGRFHARPVDPRDARGRSWEGCELLAEAGIFGLKLSVLLLGRLQRLLEVTDLAAQPGCFRFGTERGRGGNAGGCKRSLFQGLLLDRRRGRRLLEADGIEDASANDRSRADEEKPAHILPMPGLDVGIAAVVDGLGDRIGNAHCASSSI